MSELGQKAKCSRRADVFRCSPNNGHRSIVSVCPFGAKTGSRSRLAAVRPFANWVGLADIQFLLKAVPDRSAH
jgi:hypothetical protein